MRVEQQATAQTTLGLELGGGRGDGADPVGVTGRPGWLLAVRGYGRSAPGGHDNVAGTYGVGVSVLSTGTVTGSVHLGGAAAATNDYLVPTLQLSTALAVPLRPGRPWGAPARTPATRLWLALDGGLLVPIGDTGNVTSVDLALALAAGAGEVMAALSLADAHRF
ncbi:MAG: hypothetical protein R2939_01255 [Kofleriaceae bacterium]